MRRPSAERATHSRLPPGRANKSGDTLSSSLTHLIATKFVLPVILVSPFVVLSIASSHDDDGCSNTCDYANDGECDDGGNGSEYDLCSLGTDCDDCGERGSGVGGGGSGSGGGGGSGSTIFTCFSGDLCVEYTITDADRGASLRSQCADGVDGHDCARGGGRASCRHTATSGDVTCTVTTDPPASHDELCEPEGTVGC